MSKRIRICNIVLELDIKYIFIRLVLYNVYLNKIQGTHFASYSFHKFIIKMMNPKLKKEDKNFAFQNLFTYEHHEYGIQCIKFYLKIK